MVEFVGVFAEKENRLLAGLLLDPRLQEVGDLRKFQFNI
jgi:hypothetical protein